MPTFTWTVSSSLVPGRVEARMVVPSPGAAVSATNNGGGPTTVTVPAANYYLTAAGGIAGLLATFEAQLNASRPPSAGVWTLSLDTSTGLVTINCPGTWSLVWTNTTLRDILGFAADIAAVATAQTGTKHARALWLPGCPLMIDGDPYQAPKKTDLRSSESPTGELLSLIGNYKYRQVSITWSHVRRDRAWESYVTYANGSWEYFFNETQLGLGSSWFTPSSKVQIYWDNAGVDTLLGAAGNAGAGLSGWWVKGVDSTELRPSVEGFSGYFRVQIPEIGSNG